MIYVDIAKIEHIRVSAHVNGGRVHYQVNGREQSVSFSGAASITLRDAFVEKLMSLLRKHNNPLMEI